MLTWNVLELYEFSIPTRNLNRTGSPNRNRSMDIASDTLNKSNDASKTFWHRLGIIFYSYIDVICLYL